MNICSKEDELVQRFENTNPEEFLNELSDSTGSTKENFEILEQIWKYNLPDSVLNVLIHFTFRIFDTKLSKSFMEKIAIDWIRKKVKTPREAMELSTKRYREYREWAKNAAKEDREAKKPSQLNKIESTRSKAIELAASSSSMSDEDLGKFVREMFKSWF